MTEREALLERPQRRRAAHDAVGYRGAEIRFMLLPASQCEIVDTWTVGGLRGAEHTVSTPEGFASHAVTPLPAPGDC